MPQPHSEAVLSDRRDRWWHDDYLALVAARLALHRHDFVLDVGAGQGHWGQRVLPLLAPGARLHGLDMESRWVEHAAQRAERLGLGARCRYQVGSAEALPFPADTFSLVTCQTLLMHVRDPEVAVREMLRVLRPGGRLLLAEPSNLASHFATDSVHRALTPSQVADVCLLLVTCARGRAQLGRGDDSAGDVLPTLLQRLGLRDLALFQNDRTNLTLPPYDEAARAQLEEETSYITRRFWLWDEQDARVLFAAGGGVPADFARTYAAFQARTELFLAQVADQSFRRPGASFHFLISATKPA